MPKKVKVSEPKMQVRTQELVFERPDVHTLIGVYAVIIGFAMGAIFGLSVNLGNACVF